MKTLLHIAVAGLLLGTAGPTRALSLIPPPDLRHTPLHAAAEKGDAAQARELIKAMRGRERKAALNGLDREGYSPLAYAARAGSLEIVQLLVKAGATVDLTDDHGGWTPLLQAADQRHAAVVGYLLDHGANPNVVTRIGKTPLSVALAGSIFTFGPAGDRDATVRVLLAKGADPAPLLRWLDQAREAASQPAPLPAGYQEERRQMLDMIRRLEEECRQLQETIARIRAVTGDHVPRPNG